MIELLHIEYFVVYIIHEVKEYVKLFLESFTQLSANDKCCRV